MSQPAPTPTHITKYTNNYEKRLIDILVNYRGMSLSDVLSQRDKYSRSLERSSAIDEIQDKFPLTVNIELLNKCNYKCSMCYTVNHDGAGVSLGVETAVRIIDECAEHGLMTLFIANGSEPTISTDFKEVVNYATSRIPDVAVFTNAVKLDSEMTEFLLKSGITRLNISLDAASKETYKTIRGGDLNQIENNILHFLDQRGGLRPPLIRVSFVEQPQNQHEVTDFIAKWINIVDSVEIQCLQDFKAIPSLPVLVTPADLDIQKIFTDRHCYSPYSYIAVWSNGQISPCCSFHGTKIDLGNAKSGDTVNEAWNGDTMKTLRNQFRNSSVNVVCADCLLCTNYK